MYTVYIVYRLYNIRTLTYTFIELNNQENSVYRGVRMRLSLRMYGIFVIVYIFGEIGWIALHLWTTNMNLSLT